MGRLLYFRRDEDARHPLPVGSTPKTGQTTSESLAPASVDPWMVVVIVVGSLIVATLAIFMCAHYIKSRRGRRDGFQPMEEMKSPYPQKRRRPGTVDRQSAEDVERDMMIRKSLASRTSLTASDPVSQVSSVSTGGYQLAHPLGDESEMTGLKEDWKAWEASVQSERRSSTPGGVGLDQHPAFAPYLSVPQPTRMASPARGGGPTGYRHI
ncbi:hypothetical protein F5Y09DRAFT_111052 [Xylaria sp. FL1042]|nr:hypothetical protein F5Y09DRAFT_111052 [Xylaria sp. FL1042]